MHDRRMEPEQKLGANILEVAKFSCIQSSPLAVFLVLVHLNENLDKLEPSTACNFHWVLCCITKKAFYLSKKLAF